MTDDQRRGAGRPGRPHGDKPSKSYRGKSGGPPPGGKPYGGKPGGKPGQPYGGQPGKPYRGKAYGGKPGKPGKPYRGKAYGGKPGERPHESREQGRQPAPDGTPHDFERRPPAGGPARDRGHDRRVEHSHQPRPGGPRPGGPRPGGPRPGGPRRGGSRPGGPRPPRGSWDRDGGGYRPRPERYPPRPPGPTLAEVLGEDEEVVAGRRPVEEAFAARREAKRLLVVPERRSALDQLVLHATTLRIPVVEVEGGTITAVTGFDGHQGVALVVAPRRWATLDEVLALARTRGEPPFLLALDHLEDPQNVGTLLRSAEACGVHGVVFPTKGAAPLSPAAIKTSAGAVEHLLLVPMPDLAGALVDLHARGVRVIGADGDASMTVREADLRGPIVIVTGSEGRGLNARVRKRVDLMARIPMRGKVASLNASVAGSVFLFEAAAQRELPEREADPAETEGKAALATVGVESVDGESASASAHGSKASTPTEAPATTAEAARERGPDAPDAPDAPDGPGGPVVDPDDLLPETPPA